MTTRSSFWNQQIGTIPGCWGLWFLLQMFDPWLTSWGDLTTVEDPAEEMAWLAQFRWKRKGWTFFRGGPKGCSTKRLETISFGEDFRMEMWESSKCFIEWIYIKPIYNLNWFSFNTLQRLHIWGGRTWGGSRIDLCGSRFGACPENPETWRQSDDVEWWWFQGWFDAEVVSSISGVLEYDGLVQCEFRIPRLSGDLRRWTKRT